MFACNGILFNHESPRRGETFVTRKITLGLTSIGKGIQESVYVGNLDAEETEDILKIMLNYSGEFCNKRSLKTLLSHWKARKCKEFY